MDDADHFHAQTCFYILVDKADLSITITWIKFKHFASTVKVGLDVTYKSTIFIDCS